MYSYVIEVADSESVFGFYNKGLVSKIRVLDFLRMIRVPFTLETIIAIQSSMDVWYLCSSELYPFCNIG